MLQAFHAFDAASMLTLTNARSALSQVVSDARRIEAAWKDLQATIEVVEPAEEYSQAHQGRRTTSFPAIDTLRWPRTGQWVRRIPIPDALSWACMRTMK